MFPISRQKNDIDKQPYIYAHEHHVFIKQEETKVNNGFRQHLPKPEHDNSRPHGPKQEHSLKRKLCADARPDREILIQVSISNMIMTNADIKGAGTWIEP